MIILLLPAMVVLLILFVVFLVLSADYHDRKDGHEDFW